MRSVSEIITGRVPVTAERSLSPRGCGGCAGKATAGIDLAEIVGRDFILARFHQTIGGVFLEPFERIRLEPAGAVSLLAEPTVWSTYGAGFAIFPRTAIPSITFNRMIANLPIGYFNFEGSIPHHVALVPDVPPRWGRTIYLIASCERFYLRTVPRVIEQLRRDGVPNDNIKVVINGSRRDQDEWRDGVAYAFTRHNAWEFSALYEAPRRFEFDHAWMMHDTVRIDPGFPSRAWKIGGALPWDHCPASPLGRCCLGIFSRPYLERLQDWLGSLDGMSKIQAITVECAADLIQRARFASAFSGTKVDEWIERRDEWGTGNERLRRYFAHLGLHKFTCIDPVLAPQL